VVWVKLDDGFVRHPRMVAAGLHGRALFIAGLCYCGAHLTDGRIPKAAIPMLVAEAGVKAATWRTLIDVGSWIDHGDHIEVHDFLVYNPSRDKVLGEREAGAERQRRARSRSESRVSHTVTAGGTSRDPTRPEPEVPSEPSTHVAIDADFESWWEGYPRKIAKQHALKAYRTASKHTTPEQLLAGLEASKCAWARERRPIDKIPHAATWLNGHRWADDHGHTATESTESSLVGSGPVTATVVELPA
jgi:hypothetical protein